MARVPDIYELRIKDFPHLFNNLVHLNTARKAGYAINDHEGGWVLFADQQLPGLGLFLLRYFSGKFNTNNILTINSDRLSGK
jgi:hypothetical protein